MKILMFMDISVTRCYEYIRIYREISIDILTQNISEMEID